MYLLASIVSILVLWADWYLWKKYFKGRGLLCWLWWLPTVLLFLFVIGAISGQWHTFFMRASYLLIFVSVFPKFIYILFHKLVGRKIALCLSAGAILFFFYGMTIGFHRLSIKEEVFESEDIPAAFDGYRIVQLSDLHLGTYSKGSDFVTRIIDSTLALKPDLIVFTGDMVNTDAAEMLPFMDDLKRLTAPDGVFSITGNHDYGFDKAAVDQAFGQIKELEESAGMQLLANGHVALARGADTLYLAGVENTSKNFFISRGDLSKALEGIPEGTFKILLTHDPKHWRAEVLPNSDVQLTLSGHTHAMQLKIFGLSPAALMFKEWGGKYLSEDGKRMLNVSEGIGGILPFRVGADPQIVLITLKKK